jgi:3-hydroxyacyl-[acyl-carrier-protein] dehydratase
MTGQTVTRETIESADIREILKLLPHRYPFVMIDRIVDIKGEDHGIGIKNITFNEPQFLGHFPDNPVMPGVLLIEGMAQTAGVLCLRQMDETTRKNAIFYFLTIDKAKFRKPAVPGDIVEYHVNKTAHRRNMWWYRAEAKVGGALIAEAEVGAVITEA